jgi:hypothetical protein
MRTLLQHIKVLTVATTTTTSVMVTKQKNKRKEKRNAKYTNGDVSFKGWS